MSLLPPFVNPLHLRGYWQPKTISSCDALNLISFCFLVLQTICLCECDVNLYDNNLNIWPPCSLCHLSHLYLCDCKLSIGFNAFKICFALLILTDKLGPSWLFNQINLIVDFHIISEGHLFNPIFSIAKFDHRVTTMYTLILTNNAIWSPLNIGHHLNHLLHL